ncbi:MAG: Chromosome partition protein Smc [Mycoplasmataceae bacterium]|nr:MAG: Chromosome partition protein Smc [Mycoplasmataceae bacterium]
MGAIVGVCAAPFTAGASLGVAAALGGIGFVGGKAAEATGILDNGDDSNDTKMEAWKVQNDQWLALVQANRAEVEQLRKDRDSKEGKIKHNNDEVSRLNSIINNPNSTPEEKSNAKKRIVLLEDSNKQLKKDIAKLEQDISDKSKTPPQPSKPWILPNLKFVDKVMIAGGVVLLVYLLIPNKKKD